MRCGKNSKVILMIIGALGTMFHRKVALTHSGNNIKSQISIQNGLQLRYCAELTISHASHRRLVVEDGLSLESEKL